MFFNANDTDLFGFSLFALGNTIQFQNGSTQNAAISLQNGDTIVFSETNVPHVLTVRLVGYGGSFDVLSNTDTVLGTFYLNSSSANRTPITYTCVFSSPASLGLVKRENGTTLIQHISIDIVGPGLIA